MQILYRKKAVLKSWKMKKDPGKIMEQSWNFSFENWWEPYFCHLLIFFQEKLWYVFVNAQTQFAKIKNKKGYPDNQFEKHNNSSLVGMARLIKISVNQLLSMDVLFIYSIKIQV